MPKGYPKNGINKGWFQKGVRQPEEIIQKSVLARTGKTLPVEKKSGAIFQCESCGNDFYVYRCRIIREEKKGKKPRFCSIKCYSRKGEKNYFWKGGNNKDRDGYVRTWNGQRIREHRLVAENILGRKLLKTEVIHHINKIRDDNRPENLRVMDVKEHNHYHTHIEKLGIILESNLCQHTK